MADGAREPHAAPKSASDDETAQLSAEGDSRRPLWLRIAGNAALVLASLLVGIILLEALVRLAFAAPRAQGKQLLTMELRHHHAANNRGADCYPSNARGYFDKTDASAWPGAKLLETEAYREIAMDRLAQTRWCVTFSNNDHAHRGKSHSGLTRQPNTFRILAVGDSFTYGEGVKDEDTMPAQLERVLQARHPELAVEVINLGEPGINTETEILITAAHADLGADVVVLGYVLNDAFRAPSIDAKKHGADDLVMFRPGKIEKPSGTSRWLRKVSRLYALVAARMDQRRIHKQTLSWYSEAFDPVKNADALRKTEMMIAKLAATAKQQGASTLVAVYPILYKLGESYPFRKAHAVLEEILARQQLPSLDLREAYQGKKADALVVHAVDHHPNELAQRLAAEAIAAKLDSLGLVKARTP